VERIELRVLTEISTLGTAEGRKTLRLCKTRRLRHECDPGLESGVTVPAMPAIRL